VEQLATSYIFSVLGYDINLMFVMIVAIIAGILVLFYRIQASDRLDFADMLTKDGRAVSLTKVLQLVGGMTATWIMIKLTISGSLSETVLGIYLAYVGGIEGYSKFISAKYGYTEKSVKDAASDVEGAVDDGANVKTN
jgi:hypothetical protein